MSQTNKVKRLNFAMTAVGRMKYTNILVLISKKILSQMQISNEGTKEVQLVIKKCEYIAKCLSLLILSYIRHLTL